MKSIHHKIYSLVAVQNQITGNFQLFPAPAKSNLMDVHFDRIFFHLASLELPSHEISFEFCHGPTPPCLHRQQKILNIRNRQLKAVVTSMAKF